MVESGEQRPAAGWCRAVVDVCQESCKDLLHGPEVPGEWPAWLDEDSSTLRRQVAVRHNNFWCEGFKGNVPCCVPLQVYANLQPKPHFLQLLDDGAGLKAAWEAFRAMEAAIGVLNWYYALNGISILLLIARCVLAGWAWGCCSDVLTPARGHSVLTRV